VPADDFSRYLPEMTAFTERLRFNVPYRGPQKFAWQEISLAQVKAIRQACGTSVNDVVLALMTSTIRRYAELHGDKVKGKLLRMMVPVNLRGGESPAELGNRISLVPVTIPLDIKDPRKLLAAAHARTEFIKRTHAAELISLTGGMIGMFPASLQALVGPLVSRLPITPFNLVCTNVPGPQFPLYLRGHKILSWYPYVPVGGEMALNCAILSYNGTMYFGFSGDVHAAPDLRRLETLLKDSFRELREAALAGPPSKAPGKKKTSARPKARAKAETKPRHEVPAKPPVSAAPASSVVPDEKTESAKNEEEITAQLIA
jgi:diacylglycerol O-acyltransferase